MIEIKRYMNFNKVLSIDILDRLYFKYSYLLHYI